MKGGGARPSLPFGAECPDPVGPIGAAARFRVRGLSPIIQAGLTENAH